MAGTLLYAAGAVGIAAIALLARHERAVMKARRESIIDPVRGLFHEARIEYDGAGFPKVDGTYGRRHLKVELIPDTMTVKRLPQLWLSLTALKSTNVGNGGVSILIRPSGNDYYSLTHIMSTHLDPPSELPWECLVRGQSEASRATLNTIRSVAGAVFAEPKVKEIAVTQRGIRIVYQLSEGRRGPHLILRQSDFENAALEPKLLAHLAAELDALAAVLGIDLMEKSA